MDVSLTTDERSSFFVPFGRVQVSRQLDSADHLDFSGRGSQPGHSLEGMWLRVVGETC
jgi:hypothetical protein